MKVLLSRSKLAQVIGKIQTVVPLKPAIPILSTVLLEGREGKLILTALDSAVSMRTEMEAQVEEEGAVVLPGRNFFQLTRELTTEQITLASTDGASASIGAETSQFKLNGMRANTFPYFPEPQGGASFSIGVKQLKELLGRSIFAVAREDSRHLLKGVLLRIEEGRAICIGTDGKKLAKLSAEIEGEALPLGSYPIPLKGVEEALKLAEEEEELLTVRVMGEKLVFECGASILVVHLLAGEYPDVERIIPKESLHTLTLHREEMMALLRQVGIFMKDKGHSIQFTFTPGELILSSQAQEIGAGKVSIPIDYSGEIFEIAFNPFFFNDILRHCSDETVQLHITNPHQPGLITDSTTARFILMPMRLNPVS